MQQPTPAPTERGESPPAASSKGRARDNVASAEDHPIDYPEPPKNVDSTPFYVLATLFDYLQNERSFEKRRKHLQRWFNVCFCPCSRAFSIPETRLVALARREGTLWLFRESAHCRPDMHRVGVQWLSFKVREGCVVIHT